MKIDITEDYKSILKSISEYFNVDDSTIKVMEENNQEFVVDNKNKVISVLDYKYWQWVNEKVESSEREKLKHPVLYAKIMFDDQSSLKNRNVYEIDKSGYLILRKTELEKEKQLLDEKFHWSEVCSPYESIVDFWEEKEFWNLE